MENVNVEISMEIGALMFSMEFHGKCPNPPCKYFPWKSMERIPWRIFHGNPWNSVEFHGGFSHGQCLHSKRFSPVWTISYLLRVPASLKHLPHCLHSKRFSPVWTLSCILRLPASLKHLPHCLHSKRFSPVWTISCLLRLPATVKHLPHCLHS